MPVLTPQHPNPPTFYPKRDYAVAKYLDVTKFISLLQRKALFFCRLDKLEDPFEGTIPQANFRPTVKYYNKLRSENFFETPITDEQISANFTLSSEYQVKLKSLICVNCWNNFNGESAALWKIYSDFNKGIMLKSSISKLVGSVSSLKEDLVLSEVKYVDFAKEVIPDHNVFFPAQHKHKAYNYEKEVRLIHMLNLNKGYQYDWSKEEIQEGLFFSLNLNVLVEEIILSPFAPVWYFKMIEDLAYKYELDVSVKRSELNA